MAMFSVNPYRFDPYQGFKFRVKWDGRVVPAVFRVSALRRVTETVEHREGGDPSTSRQAPGATRFEPIVLERGLTHDPCFEQWANLVFNPQGDAAMSLRSYRKEVTIELLNHQGSVVMAFQVHRCWVAEYQALPDLDANGTCVAVERLTLAHEGWERDPAVTEPPET
jgi:phage tail-like protein